MRKILWVGLILFGLMLIGIVVLIPHGKATSPYDYINAPVSGNGMGLNVAKDVNWTFFKNVFQEHMKWILEYKRYFYSDWTNGSSYLTIQKTWNVEGYWKFKLILNVPVNIYSARFIFGIDINCLQFINRSGYEVWVNYTANETETYYCMFNWSDIANIPGIVFTKGKTNNMFWFMFRKDNIPSGHYEFDPYFGYNSIGPNTQNTENLTVGSWNPDDNVPYNSICKSVWVYLGSTTSTHKSFCGMYRSTSQSAGTLMGYTEEKIISTTSQWYQFNFTVPIVLNPGYHYRPVVLSNLTTGMCNIYTTVVGTIYFKYQGYNYSYPSLPVPYLPGTSGFRKLSMYVPYSYVISSSVYPVNNSFAHANVTLSSVLYDTNGGKFNYSIYQKNVAGTYYLVSSQDGVNNLTIYSRWFNATQVGYNYFWKIILKNYTKQCWNNATYNFILKFHNDTLTSLPHIVNASGAVQYAWNNTFGFTVWSNYTGNITSVTWSNNHINDTWSHVKTLLSNNSWFIFDNDTGNTTPIVLYQNPVNASGTYVYHLTSTGYKVWANYTGNTTPVFLFQNYVNATGTHVSQLRSPGWYVWANVTGNASTAPGTGIGTVMLNFTGLQGFIDWTGDYTVNSTNISFLVTTNMSLNGSVHVNEDAYFLSGMLSLDPAATILSLFFGFFYIGYKSDKRSGGWFMLFAGFLLIALGILIYGILGYAAALVTPFAIFIMILGVKKGLYGPETTGSDASDGKHLNHNKN